MVEQYEYIIYLNDKMTGAMQKVASLSNTRYQQMINQQERLNRSTNNYGRTIQRVFGGYLGVQTIGSIIKTTAQFESMDNTIKFVSGSAMEAEKNFAFLDSMVNKMGLNIESTREGFQVFTGSFKGTSIGMEQQRKMFEQTNTAIAALGLNGERAKLVMLAMGQMASKGVVSMEELRRQLGDSIPGAFAIGARAMGMTTREFDKMVSQGKIMSDVFLPRFAAQLEKDFKGGLEAASQSTQANINRITNSITSLKLLGGDVIQPLIKELTPAADRMKEWAQTTKISSESVLRWANIAMKAIKILAIYKTSVFLTSKSMQIFNAIQARSSLAMLQYRTAMAVAKIETTAFTRATVLAKVTWQGFSAAMKANAIGLAITGVTLLISKLISIRQSAKDAEDAQKGLNDEFEKTFDIANKLKMEDFLKNSGYFKEVYLGNVNGLKLYTNELQKSSSEIEHYIKSAKSLEELRSLNEIFNTELINSQRNLNNIIEQSKGQGGLLFQESISADMQNKISSYSNILKILGLEISKYDKISNAGSAGLNLSSVNETANNIISGGSKPTNITVNLQKLQDKTEIHATTIKEGVQDMEKAVLEGLLRVLNSSQKLAAQ